jgi:mono/diheme cytochrome c family protein
MTSRSACFLAISVSLAAVGCGIQGDGGLHPVNAVTVASLPEDMRPKSAPADPVETKADKRESEDLLGGPGGRESTLPGRPLASKPQAYRTRGGPDLGIPGGGPATPAAEIGPARPASPESDSELAPDDEALYRQNCQPCHSLDLVEHQRLDRDDWEWVLDDMIEIYGASWIKPKQKSRLLEFLVERFGPEAVRDLEGAPPAESPPVADEAPPEAPPPAR